MTVEISLLVWSVALCFAQVLVAAIGNTQQIGLPLLIGNRENMPTPTGWVGRAQRGMQYRPRRQ